MTVYESICQPLRHMQKDYASQVCPIWTAETTTSNRLAMGLNIHEFHYRVATGGQMQYIVGDCGSTQQDSTFSSLLGHDEMRAVGR
jgi:hypothetical protein